MDDSRMVIRPDNSSGQRKEQLFNKQKDTLDMLLQHGAITQVQYEKSLYDLKEKMGIR